MRPELIIFDCDGVLIDSEIISARMLVDELAGYGVTIDLAYVIRNFLGRSYPVVMEQIRTEFGVTLPDGFEADYRARLIAAFRSGLKIMPGVKSVLDRLAVPFCLATSSSPARLAESLEMVGLAEHFAGRITTASEVANGKPAPDLFFRVAEKMGVEPGGCLVIEDSHPGVRAARAAGMAVWRFTGGSHLAGIALETPIDARADREFASFDEFFHIAPDLDSRGAADEQA
jgi:HAD superfamily hydrolase (TIGR01509 family)